MIYTGCRLHIINYLFLFNESFKITLRSRHSTDVKTESEENKTKNQQLLVADDRLHVKKNEGI